MHEGQLDSVAQLSIERFKNGARAKLLIQQSRKNNDAQGRQCAVCQLLIIQN